VAQVVYSVKALKSTQNSDQVNHPLTSSFLHSPLQSWGTVHYSHTSSFQSINNIERCTSQATMANKAALMSISVLISKTPAKATAQWLIDWARFNVPLNTLWVISGMGFYGSNDPTNSVKALKEVVVLRIRIQSHMVHLTMLQYYNI